MVFLRIVVLGFLVAYGFGMASQGALNAFGTFIAFSLILTLPALYLLPTYEAWRRNQPNLTTITLVNLLLGWSLIGWVVAMVMALKSTAPAKVEIVASAEFGGAADELEKLASLKERGLLSEDEFAQQKAKVLQRA